MKHCGAPTSKYGTTSGANATKKFSSAKARIILLTHTKFLMSPICGNIHIILITKSSHKDFFVRAFFVGVTGFEPATPWSQTRCATNCATPRNCFKSLLNYSRMVSNTGMQRYNFFSTSQHFRQQKFTKKSDKACLVGFSKLILQILLSFIILINI